jgi:hypothetical protein
VKNWLLMHRAVMGTQVLAVLFRLQTQTGT